MIPRLKVDLVGSTPVCKLSKPGVDVETASDLDLLFDISQGVYGGVFQSGSVPFSSFTASSAANFYGWSNYFRYEIPFGKTFAAIPKIGLSFNDPLLGAGWYGPQYAPAARASAR